MSRVRMLLEIVSVSAAVVALACAAVACGVVGLAVLAGESRNRYCERKGWRHLSRWRT